MRYIGNKNKLLEQIREFTYSNAGCEFTTFCDLFSGTGLVGSVFAEKHTIIANDILRSAYILTNAQLNQPKELDFPNLEHDPFELFNASDSRIVGFIAENYAPKLSPRMYFSDENAERIDFIRISIEKWRLEDRLSDNEYYYLLACLLESVSKVANIAGVYGSYLKSWDPRAIKPLIFLKIPVVRKLEHINEVSNEDSIGYIEHAVGDVLYIDPPYTKNDYSVQYHLLETIALYDDPQIKGKTGGRFDTKRSKFSSLSDAHVAFEKIIAEAKFKHIVVSYSNKGLLEKDFIEKCLKKYSVADTYKCKVISHPNYTNLNSLRDVSLEEYLFYIEKSDFTLIESPLNYMGSKYNIVEDLIKFTNFIPTTFVDVFGGGFNVGVNSGSKYVVYNDINHFVRGIVELFYNEDGAYLLNRILRTIKKHHLEKNNKEAFVKFRTLYNAALPGKRTFLSLYVLLQYGFQQQFRFNAQHEFNNTSGMSNFNNNTILKLLSFCRVIKSKNVTFHSVDFEEILNTTYNDPLYYCDPPYLVTLGSYNDGKRGFKGWGEEDDRRLYRKLDKLNNEGKKFVLSNVVSHKGRTNNILVDWIKTKGYETQEVYYKNRIEIMVKNF